MQTTQPATIRPELQHIAEAASLQIEENKANRQKQLAQSKLFISKLARSKSLKILAIIGLLAFGTKDVNKYWSYESVKYNNLNPITFENQTKLMGPISLNSLSMDHFAEIWSWNHVIIDFNIPGSKETDVRFKSITIWDKLTEQWFSADTISNIRLYKKNWKKETLVWEKSYVNQYGAVQFYNWNVIIPKWEISRYHIEVEFKKNKQAIGRSFQPAIVNIELSSTDNWDKIYTGNIDYSSLASNRVVTITDTQLNLANIGEY